MPSPLRRWRRRSGPSRGVSPRSRPGDAGRAPSLALWALANPRRRPPPGQHRGETATLGAGAWSPYCRSHSSRSPTGRGLIRCRRVRNSTHAAPLTGLPLRASRFLAACPRSPGLTTALRFTKAPTEPTGGAPTKPAWWGAPGEYLARLIAAFSSRWWRAPPPSHVQCSAQPRSWIEPHRWHVFELGKYRSASTNSEPYQPVL